MSTDKVVTNHLSGRSTARGLALGCVLVLAGAGCSTTTASPTTASPTSASPTTASPADASPPVAVRPSARTTPVTTQTPLSKPALAPARSAAVTKVLVFIEENHSLSQMKADMPYAFGLAQQFGYATAYSAIGHPSLPNYIAIAGGKTHGITNDDPPSANPVSGTSVFGQTLAAGRTAGLYADGMPQSCATSDGAPDASGSHYAVKHNPWAYFVDERDACQRYDVPVARLGGAIAGGTLPNVGMVIPDLCHDAHDCSLGTADAWFKGWMTKVLEGPDWKSGHLAVVLTADEDDHSGANTVLTVVIHPSQRANVVTTALTHYSLTRLLEETAGTPYLFAAASAPSMASAFGLPLR